MVVTDISQSFGKSRRFEISITTVVGPSWGAGIMGLKTKLHKYSFNIGKRNEREQYEALVEKLKQDPDRRFFNVLEIPPYNSNFHDSLPEDIELETEFLFSNQWNTTSGHRIFDWYEAIISNRDLKRGHWLEITDEMRKIRNSTLVCGYCGKYEPEDSGKTFCEKCLDSPYLKETDLNLLRLLPVALHFPHRSPITEAEEKELLPKYIDRQTKGADSRAVQQKANQRKRVQEKYEESRDAAETEYKGMIWLLDRDISIENVIFYSHTGKFSFGWRNPLSKSVADSLRQKLVNFPCDFEIKEG